MVDLAVESSKAPSVRRRHGGPPRAIIADDDADHRRLLASVIRRAGFDVREAADGEEVLALCEASEDDGGAPDVIVADLMMPRRSGFAILDEMKKRQPPIPVVLVSGVGDDAMAELAVSLGAAAMLHKPFDFAALKELVVRVVEEEKE